MYETAFRAERPYQLVISDLIIPGGLGGREVVEKVLALNPDARVVVISGYAADPIMEQYEEYGFAGRIAKPFKLSEVQEEIRRVCSG